MWDKPALLNWIANLLYALAMVAVLYTLVYVVVHLPIFPLREIKVDGELSHVNRAQIRLIASQHLKGNFFTLDLEKARAAFEKLPWARKVSVRRQWPDTLSVAIEEHRPLARWGQIGLVNTQGELFQAAYAGKLPVFFGPGDGVKEVALSYSSFSKILREAEISIAQVSLSPRRAWEIKSDKGMLIALGRVDMQNRLNKFTKSYKNTLAGLNVAISYVDLRYPNGFAVRKPKQLTAPIIEQGKDKTPATKKIAKAQKENGSEA